MKVLLLGDTGHERAGILRRVFECVELKSALQSDPRGIVALVCNSRQGVPREDFCFLGQHPEIPVIFVQLELDANIPNSLTGYPYVNICWGHPDAYRILIDKATALCPN
jgi:hypothetical protein